MIRNIRSLFKTICISLIAMILLTFGACALDHGQIPEEKLDVYNFVFIFNDAEGNLITEKVVEVVEGEKIRPSQIPLIKQALEREGYLVPDSYEVYWVLLNNEKQPIDLDPNAEINQLTHITSELCNNEGKVYIQIAYRKLGASVTFFSNGGTPVKSIVDLNEGDSLANSKPEDPTKVGYTFVGWFNKELTEEFNWNTTLPKEGIDLYAKWEANEETAYAVEHYLEQLDGNYKLAEVEELSAATEELVSVKALDFEGFTHDPKHLEAKLEGKVLADGSLVLKAYYARNEYTISFDVDGGEAKVEQTYKYGETLELGSTTKTGYTFLGWLLEGKEFDLQTMPAQDLELVANWMEGTGIEYKVEHYFEELDGSYTKDAKVETKVGKTGALVSAKVREVEGFEQNQAHKDALEEAEILADGSLVLKVFYSRVEYTVSFDANGGAAKAEQTYKYGQPLELGQTSKVGYTFVEWLYQGNQLVYETMPAQDLELAAKWTPNKDTLYSVEHYFEQLDGSYKLDAKVDELQAATEAKVSAIARVVAGFTHNASHKDALETANVLPDGSLVLKVYYSRNTYTLTVNVDGEKEEIEYLFEEEVEALTSPEKTGYTFKAWSPAVPANMPAQDVEVVAQWTINQYTLTINVDGVKQEVVYDYNEAVETPAVPTKTGYTFKAWSPAVPANMPAEDVEVVAQWTINQYTLTINVDGEKQEVVYDYNEAVETPAVPTKTGYTFKAWSPAVPANMPAEDVEVVATWTINQYTLTINVDGEKQEVVYDYNEAVETPAVPTKTGYTFKAWSPAVPANMPAEDVEVVATWTINQYTLTINVDGEKQEVVYDYNEEVETPAVPTKNGYSFKAWSPEVPANMPAEDVEVVATWEIVEYSISYELSGGSFNEYPKQYVNKAALVADFMNDYNKIYGTAYTKPEETHSSRTTNLWKNAEMYAKWKWMLEYFCDLAVKQDYGSENVAFYTKMYNEGKGIGTVSGYVTQSVTTYLLGIDAATWNEQYSATYTGLSSKYTTLDFTKEDENAYQKYMIFAPREYTITDSVDLLNPTRTDYIFLGWYNNSEFNGNNLTTIEEGSYGNVTLYAKWIHVVDNAKNLALAALDEYVKSDEIVNGSHYEINKVELEEEIETQKGLISAALSIESVNTSLENAKKALLAIAAPIAPTAIHLNAASNTPLVGASLALQLSFEGPEGYQNLVSYSSSNENIATVSEGIVKFLTTGNVTITVYSIIDNNIKSTIDFVVSAPDTSNVLVKADAEINDVAVYNEKEYFYGVTLFSSLSSALSKVSNSGTIHLTSGRHSLTAGLTISKSVTILGPNANKKSADQRVEEAEIYFASYYMYINAANVTFNGVKLNGNNKNTYLLASTEDLTITSCYAYNFNSFLRTDAAIAGGTIRIENNIIEKVTQFLLWVKSGHGAKLENVEFNNNIVMGTGTVGENGMLRITETSASGLKVNVFNNTFNNFASAINFLFRTACGTMTIKFNVFENVSKYFIADSGTIVFEHNLLLDQNSEPQFPETLNGVAIGDSCLSKEDLVDKYNETLGLYTIKYELNGGSFEGNYPLGYDDLEGVELVNPVQAGYNFGGWFDNESLTGDALNTIAAGTGKSLKLYAKWQAIEYNLSFVLNGGSGIFINGNPSTSMDLTAYSNDGETAGIYICDTGIIPSYSLRYQYKILLEYDAELDAYEIVAVDAAQKGISDVANDEGVIWTHALSSSSKNITTLVNRGQYIVLDSELVLDSPNVAYVYELGQFGAIEDTTFTVESEINLPTPEKEGYTFAGWYDNAEFTGEKVTMISAGTTGSKTYHAKWEEVVYTIQYELNEGLFIFDIEGNRESLIEELLIDLSAFYGKTITTTNFADIVQNSDKAAYYFFESDQTDSKGVTFEQKYGWLRTFIISKRQADASHSSGAAELSNANAQYWRYEMKGFLSGTKSSWPYSADWSNADINSELIVLLKTKIPVNSYKITTSTFALANPERTNYNFLGWYSNSTFTGDVIDAIETGTIGNITLYAKWELVLPNANVTYTANFANKTELLDAFLYDFYQFLLDKGTITNAVTFDEFSGRNNSYIGKWFEYQQLDYDPTTGTVFDAAGYTHSANHMILFNKTGVLAKDEAYFFNSTKYGAKWYSFGVWINNSIGTSNRFFTEKYGGCELLRWATGAAGANYGASFDASIYMSSLSWTVNYNTESSAIMPTMYKHGSTFAGWLDASSNLYTELPVASPVELALTPSWN